MDTFKKLNLIEKRKMAIEELVNYYAEYRIYCYNKGDKLKGIELRKKIHPLINLILKKDEVLSKEETVAVQAASKPEEMFLNMADSKIPRIRSLLSMKNRELTYPMLSKGYADALAVNEVIINQYMKDYNMELRILDEPLMTVGIGVAFSKNETRDLPEKLEQTLDEMREDGTSAKIIGKYLDDPEKYLEVDQLEEE